MANRSLGPGVEARPDVASPDFCVRQGQVRTGTTRLAVSLPTCAVVATARVRLDENNWLPINRFAGLLAINDTVPVGHLVKPCRVFAA